MQVKTKITKLDLLELRKRAMAPGTFPGQNRSRKFKDRKKDANKRACRGHVKYG